VRRAAADQARRPPRRDQRTRSPRKLTRRRTRSSSKLSLFQLAR
jgi:hypothetical protein